MKCVQCGKELTEHEAYGEPPSAIMCREHYEQTWGDVIDEQTAIADAERERLEALAEAGFFFQDASDISIDDDDEFDTNLCSMTSDGDCLSVGTEFCDWHCPYSRELR